MGVASHATLTPVGSVTASGSPTASPSSSGPSSSGTGSPRAVPVAATKKTSAGAEAFARYYIDQVNQSWMVPDPSLLDGLATATCTTCVNFRDTATSVLRERQHYTSAPLSVGLSVVVRESTTDLVGILRFPHFPGGF